MNPEYNLQSFVEIKSTTLKFIVLYVISNVNRRTSFFNKTTNHSPRKLSIYNIFDISFQNQSPTTITHLALCDFNKNLFSTCLMISQRDQSQTVT